ncbi:MAG: integrase [Nitrososphaerota archaeon]|nr:integrase [Candidatus Bathyarchaeota archaeon]MDW8023746.1 integrase [Nitrososphaerota archaeon]
MVARGRFELPSAGPKPLFEPISWKEVRNGFLVWAKGRFGSRYVKDLRNTLNKWSPVIRSVEDIDRLFSGEFPGKRHLWFGIRNLLKYCASHGWSGDEIKPLLEAMPPVKKANPDNKVPKEAQVLETLMKLNGAPYPVQAVYNLVLDSAIRPLHAVEIINRFDESRLEPCEGGFFKYWVSIERGIKHTFIAFLSQETLGIIRNTLRPIGEHVYQHYAWRRGLLRAKLLQKFAYNMMRKNGVDRDIAEFISGRKPEGIGAKHYTELIMLAEEQYPKYASYLKSLRGRGGVGLE